jgi:dihydrofolate synthase/folylpolyglutamate synthase
LASDAILHRLKALHPLVIDLSLDRVQRLMAALGHPELRMAPVVHVAGTNGKGSVLAFLRAILEAAGKRVHVYTSPHLVRFHERIRVAGSLIEEERLAELLERCERINASQPITFFEITTAAAYLAFAETPADVCLIETGLGGRLDATNIFPHPRLNLITPIAMDHMHYLGDNLPLIAAEKAGILRPGVPCLIGPQAPAAAQVLAAKANDLGAPALWAGRDWGATLQGGQTHWWGGTRKLALPPPGLAGAHQIDNAAMALTAAAELSEFAISEGAMAAGLTKVEWPGRLQRLRRGPLVEAAPEGAEVWLDGAHNPAAAQAIASAARALADADAQSGLAQRPLFLMVGMLNTKEAQLFFAPFAGLARSAFTVAIPQSESSFTAAELATAAQAQGIAAEAAGSLLEALQKLRRNSAHVIAPRILITGSLYLAGAVLEAND